MPSIWIRLAFVGAVLLGIAAVAVAHLASSQAYANGRTVEFERQVAGSYEIAFGKIPPTPIVGNFFVSILLTDAASKAPVMGANVVMSATGPPIEGETSPMRDGPEIGPIVVQPDPNPEQYPGILRLRNHHAGQAGAGGHSACWWTARPVARRQRSFR